jgi:hypothetical protein
MSKQYTEAQKKALIKDMQQWPKGLMDVNRLAQKAVVDLRAKGKSDDVANDMVMEILKECASDIQKGHYGLVCEILEMTFFNKDVTKINVNKILNDFK